MFMKLNYMVLAIDNKYEIKYVRGGKGCLAVVNFYCFLPCIDEMVSGFIRKSHY